VLLGGGNTSVKLRNGTGEEMLYVKGSGADLAHVTERDFTPLKLAPVRAMLRHASLDYAAMMRELQDHIVAPDAPRPSIETLLHAALPARYVEHTHADAILAITNTESGIALAEKVFGDIALVVPYRHSGFALAKICAETWDSRAGPATIGIILMHHGAVACGATAEESYRNMLRLVACAEDYLTAHGAKALPEALPKPLDANGARHIAALRRDISRVAGYPLLLKRCEDPVANAFAQYANLKTLASESPATPQHAVFARRVPMLGRDVNAFAASYADYLQALPEGPRRLDAAPRIVFDPELGMLAAGITPWHMDAAAVSYRHTVGTMMRASVHDRYRGLPALNVLEAELEYGGFEHRIAEHRAANVALAGTVSMLAPSLADAGELIRSELNAAGGAAFVADSQACADSCVAVVTRFGGIDHLICAVGDGRWVKQALPWLALSPCKARVVVLGPGEIKAIRDMCDAEGVEVVAIEKNPALVAKQVINALAIAPVETFPAYA
jgi:rhamnose utilization protein RhaD (predicted bifunctional aldolase and dehydrogenase)